MATETSTVKKSSILVTLNGYSILKENKNAAGLVTGSSQQNLKKAFLSIAHLVHKCCIYIM
jgi:hypothetical protein